MFDSTDPLTAILASLRLSGSISSFAQLRTPWGVSISPRTGAVFHAVTRGSCWVSPQPGVAPLRLEAGDLVLFPSGQEHVLADQPGRPARTAECLMRSGWLADGRLRGGGDGALTEFICGEFQVDNAGKHPLWSQLPSLVHLRDEPTANTPSLGLRRTLRQLAAEVKQPRLGSELVVARLLDVLVVEVVRAWLGRQQPMSAGWLGGMRDTKIGAALGLMHQDPQRNWTVASLASAVGTSRTVFAESFAAFVGQSPLVYLTYARMQVAASLLRRDPADAMISVAEKVGYKSEAAFSKAFKRVLGVSPGAYRRGASLGDSGQQPLRLRQCTHLSH